MGLANVAAMALHQLPQALLSRHQEVAFSILVLVTSFAALGIVAAGGWPGAPNHCVLAGDCYCEAPRRGVVAQPANTWSLLAFSLAGLGIALHSSRARRRSSISPANRMTRTSLYPTLYCGIVSFMGPGGMFFHASLTDWGGAVDVLSMFLWINFLIVYDLTVILRWSERRFLVVYSSATAVLMLPRIIYGPAGVPLFAFVFGVWLLLELALSCPDGIPGCSGIAYRDRRWLVAYGTISGVALGIWMASHGNGPLCRPDSLLQGHAVWHVLNAVAFVMLYPYLWSEQTDDRAAQRDAAADAAQRSRRTLGRLRSTVRSGHAR